MFFTFCEVLRLCEKVRTVSNQQTGIVQLVDYTVYYSERGNKTDLRQFTEEEEACEEFIKRVKKYLILL